MLNKPRLFTNPLCTIFILFSWMQFSFADVTITSGVGDVNLPAGGGTATAASDVTRTGRVYGADGNGYWRVINYGILNEQFWGTIILDDSLGGAVENAGNGIIDMPDGAISISGTNAMVTNKDNAQIIALGMSRAVAMYNNNGNGTVINQDNAKILSLDNAIWIIADGTVINSDNAVISANQFFGVRIFGNGTVINQDNAQISAGAGGAVRIEGNGTVMNLDHAQISAGLTGNAVCIDGVGIVVNHGNIYSSGIYGVIFDGVNSTDTLYNSGIISGTPIAVSMGSGDDMVVLHTGSQIYGIMDGGADTDLLWLDGSGTLNNEVQNFEVLEKTGPGTWGLNTGLSVYLTAVEEGTLTINSGGVLATSDIVVVDNAELVIQGGTLNSDNLLLMDGASFTYNGGGFNVANFTCETLSRLNINSDFDYPGDLNVNGPVVLNDTLTVPELTIFGNGSFSGNGHVNGSVTNYGILSPGNSIGTLSISGNYTQNNGSFNIETSPSGSCDKLYVSGHSVFNNTQLNVYTQSGHYYAHTVFDVVTSYSGLSGTFSLNAQNLTPLLYWGYRLDTNKLSLEVMRRSYESFATTSNQWAVAHTLDAVEGMAASDFATVLDVVDYFNEQGIAYALDSFSPASSDAFAAGALASSYYFDDSIRNYLNDKAFLPDSKNLREGQTNVWANAFSSKEELEGTTGISGYKYTLNGMSAGADKKFSNDLLAGISAGVSDTDLDWSNSLNEGDTNSMHLGIYGQWQTEPLLLNAVLGYGTSSHEGKRFIQFADISRRAEIDYDSADYSASLGAAKNFIFNRFSLGIFEALSYTFLKEEGYTETHADSLNLKISGRDSESFKNDVGVKAALPLTYKEMSIIPNAKLSWVHEFDDEARDITGAFSDYPADQFSVSGLAGEPDLFQGEIGFSVLPVETLLLTVSYETALNDSDKSLSVWRFSARKAL